MIRSQENVAVFRLVTGQRADKVVVNDEWTTDQRATTVHISLGSDLLSVFFDLFF